LPPYRDVGLNSPYEILYGTTNDNERKQSSNTIPPFLSNYSTVHWAQNENIDGYETKQPWILIPSTAASQSMIW